MTKASKSLFQDQNLSKEELENSTVFAPRFNENGLVPAIAVDAEDSTILMVAHMNAESLALSLQTGIAHYWSRSRSSIWKKGETSGNVQEIKEIRTDCDQDVILLKVRTRVCCYANGNRSLKRLKNGYPFSGMVFARKSPSQLCMQIDGHSCSHACVCSRIRASNI